MKNVLKMILKVIILLVLVIVGFLMFSFGYWLQDTNPILSMVFSLICSCCWILLLYIVEL